jgi:MFS family permease
MSNLSGFAAIRRALAHRNFGIFTLGNMVSHVGTWVQRLAIGWLAWELTESGAWLGAVAFADLFPTVLLAPLTGAVADRVDRKNLMITTQLLMLVQAALLAWLTLAGVITIAWLIALAVMGGAVTSFNQPARLAIVPSLVPREDLASAIGINSLIFNLARFVGPMISGVLIALYGAGAAFAVNSATYLGFVLALAMIRLDPRARGPANRVKGDISSEIGDGYRYAAHHPGIGPMLIILTFVSILGRPYIELLPGFAGEVFRVDATGLAWLTSAVGLGAMLGGFWLAQRGAVVGLTSVAISAVAIMSSALIAFAATDIYWVALPALTVSGFGMIIIGVGEQTLIQNAVDPDMRGRVMGLYGMIGRGAPAIGALIMGVAASFLGFQWPVAGGAALLLLTWWWAHRRRRALAHALETEHGG